MNRFYILIFCFLPGLHISAQELSVLVRDVNSNGPVSFVNVCIEKENHKAYMVTDHAGSFRVERTFPVVVAVSGIGYKTLIDTLHSPSDTVLFLSPTVFDLDEVVVTGQTSGKRTDQSIYKVSVINRHDIEQKAATNLTGLLNNELNINLTQDGILGRTLSIRGLSGEHIKILIDGVPVVGRQNGIIDLDQLNLNNVDHIEIVEGPLSVIYGSNALGGVINIITRRKNNEKFNASVNTYYETVGTYNADAGFHFRVKKHNISVHAARNFFSGYDQDENSRFKIWKPKLQYNPGITWLYNDDKVKLSSSVDFLHEELRDKDSVRFDESVDRYYYTQRLNSSINSEIKSGTNSKLIFTGGYSFYNKIKNSYVVNLTTLSKKLVEDASLHDSTFFNLLYHRGSYILERKKIEILTGYDINYEYGSGKRINGLKDIGDYALYANFVLKPLKNVQIQPGIRMPFNTKYKSPLVYSFNLNFNPGNFILRASYGKGFRTPTLKELYLEFVDQNHHVYGNENLQPETANNFSFSGSYLYGYGKNNLQLSVDLFYNQIDDKIDFLFNSSDALWAQYYNISNYKSKGAEIGIKYQFHPRFTFKSGIALNGISSISETNDFNYSTDYTASFNYKNLKYMFQLSAFFKYTGKKNFYKGNFDINEGLLEINEDYIEGYKNLDLIFSVPLFNHRILVTTGVKNLFNTVNVFSTGSSTVHGSSDGFLPVGWGRTYFLKLGYQFIKY